LLARAEKAMKPALDQAKADVGISAAISNLGAGLGLSGLGGDDVNLDRELPAYAKRKTSSWAKDSAERITKAQSVSEIKAIVSGSPAVRSPADETVTFPQCPLRVLDLVTERRRTNATSYPTSATTVLPRAAGNLVTACSQLTTPWRHTSWQSQLRAPARRSGHNATPAAASTSS
jgi:hypothetical protein